MPLPIRTRVRLGIALVLLVAAPCAVHASPDCFGTRYVATTGSDTANACNVQAAPCASIQHAVDMACDNEFVSVAAGDYVGDVLITHPVVVASVGPIYTHITGTGTQDVVRILSSNVTWNSMTVWNTPGVAGIHIGDATHTGLRNINMSNSTFRNNGIGIVLENTGANGTFISFNGVIARNSIANGQPDFGTGILFKGGAGRFRMISGLIHDNDGPGVRIAAPPQGQTNNRFIFVGIEIYNNGIGALGGGTAGIEAHQVTDLTLEGNSFYGHTGPTAAPDDGSIALFDAVSGASVFCNRVHDNDNGLALANGTSNVSVLSNAFYANTGTAVSVDATSAVALGLHENVFNGNATAALANQSATSVDASHSWWGAATGPGGAFAGAGDKVTGAASVAGFIPRADQPVLARRSSNSGWFYPLAACYDTLQGAIDNAAAGALVLVGAGTYFEHVTLSKPLELAGVPGGAGCSASAIDGQQGTTHRPALLVSNVGGVSIHDLTLQNAQHGAACNADSGNETGLDLQNVSASSFARLCLRGNGINEVRVYGDSDDNVFSYFDIDGAALPFNGQACSHVSQYGILVDGGAVCEGGSGATADRNHVDHATIRNVGRALNVRLATGTTITDSSLQAARSPMWDAGAFSAGVTIEAADGTVVRGNTIGNADMVEGVRIAGRPAAACYAAPNDSHGTDIDGNTISATSSAGVHIFRGANDPGTAAGSVIFCNDIHQSGVAILADDTGASAGAPTSVHDNDIHANSIGANDAAVDTLAAAPNWWGAASGPSGAGPGSGDIVTAGVLFSPFLAQPATVDADGDGLSRCQGDCNEANAAIHPGALDACNGFDDNCDGTIDEGFVPQSTTCGVGACQRSGATSCVGGGVQDSCVAGAPVAELCNGIDDDCDGTVDNVALPGPASNLLAQRVDPVTVSITWSSNLTATSSDVVRGGLAALLAAHGNFALAGDVCHPAIVSGTFQDATLPGAGDGFWYLVRGVNCGGHGTFDGGDAGQVGSRDAGIAASGACP